MSFWVDLEEKINSAGFPLDLSYFRSEIEEAMQHVSRCGFKGTSREKTRDYKFEDFALPRDQIKDWRAPLAPIPRSDSNRMFYWLFGPGFEYQRIAAILAIYYLDRQWIGLFQPTISIALFDRSRKHIGHSHAMWEFMFNRVSKTGIRSTVALIHTYSYNVWVGKQRPITFILPPLDESSRNFFGIIEYIRSNIEQKSTDPSLLTVGAAPRGVRVSFEEFATALESKLCTALVEDYLHRTTMIETRLVEMICLSLL